MQIEKNTSVAVVVNRSWANLYGVRAFLRDGREISQNNDGSHMIFAKVLDSRDEHGLWITNAGQEEENPNVKVKGVMIPWNQILTIVLQQQLSPELWSEADKMGFVSGKQL